MKEKAKVFTNEVDQTTIINRTSDIIKYTFKPQGETIGTQQVIWKLLEDTKTTYKLRNTLTGNTIILNNKDFGVAIIDPVTLTVEVFKLRQQVMDFDTFYKAIRDIIINDEEYKQSENYEQWKNCNYSLTLANK